MRLFINFPDPSPPTCKHYGWARGRENLEQAGKRIERNGGGRGWEWSESSKTNTGKRRETKPMIKFQDRDYTILRICHEQGFLTIDQVNQYIFQNCAYQITTRRIRELENVGLLKSELTPVFGNKKILRLSSVGHKVLREQIPALARHQRPLPLATMFHDHFVTSLRLRLENLWDGNWIPERHLKSTGFPQIPDGVFRFPSGIEIALELENSDKGRRRFNSLQMRWKNTKVILVLYVVTHDLLFNRILTYLDTGPEVPNFGAVLWDDLEKGIPRVKSKSGYFDIFNRRTLP